MAEYSFTTDWFNWAPPLLNAIIPLLPVRKRILEIGSFEGRSTVWFVENMLEDRGVVVAIDTWEGGEEHQPDGTAPVESMSAVEGRFDENVRIATEKFPQRYVSKVQDTSYNALASLIREGEDPFDFIYVDGSHVAKDVLTDLCMAWPLLKEGGIMVMDDYLWTGSSDVLHRPKLAVDAFVNTFAESVEVLHLGYQVAVRKKG